MVTATQLRNVPPTEELAEATAAELPRQHVLRMVVLVVVTVEETRQFPPANPEEDREVPVQARWMQVAHAPAAAAVVVLAVEAAAEAAVVLVVAVVAAAAALAEAVVEEGDENH